METSKLLLFESFNLQRALYSRILRTTFCAVAFLLGIALSLPAQTTSVVGGIVTDQQGPRLPELPSKFVTPRLAFIEAP
jgi:hypothetical protein